MTRKTIILIFCLLLTGCDNSAQNIHRYKAKTLKQYVMPQQPFIQGLLFYKNFLYISSGLYGKSAIQVIDLKNNKILKTKHIDDRFFAEGITVFNDKLYQLTFKSRIGIIYDAKTLKEIGSFQFGGQGWGLTNDGVHLIMSDGSDTLRFIDPEHFNLVKTLQVRKGNKAIFNLNELEYHQHKLYANVWGSDEIVEINPTNGQVLSIIDIKNIHPLQKDAENVANGIAFDSQNRMYIGGKHWQYLYQITAYT